MKITAIKQQVKRTDRYSVFVDNKYSFSLSETALLQQGIASGQELEPDQLEALKKASGDDKAYGNALRYIASRPRSDWEMRSYLQRKQVEEPVIDTIIDRLKGVGLIDDLAFARAWVANRHLLKNVSKRKLRQELQQKRLAPTVIDVVLHEDETDECDSLRALMAKRAHRYPDKNKLMQYLARQGFRYDDIQSVLGDVEYPS